MSVFVGITQRVATDLATGERRDALDQRWGTFLAACGLTPVPLPNHSPAALALVAAIPIVGIILTGGNDLPQFGGDVPERDETERDLFEWAERNHRPVLGICRGAQHMAHHLGGAVGPLTGHCVTRHALAPGGRMVDSYHGFGMAEAPPGGQVIFRGEDGSVEAFTADQGRMVGLMWHPEREAFPHADDLALFQRLFGSSP